MGVLWKRDEKTLVESRNSAEVSFLVDGSICDCGRHSRRFIRHQRLALLAIELAQLQQSSSNPSEFQGRIGKLMDADLRDSSRCSVLVS